MKKVRVGFSKKVQGVFTKEVIEEIKEEIKKTDNMELFTDLDFREAFVLNGKVYVGDFCLNSLDIYFWHDSVNPREWNGDNFNLNVLRALENDCLVINSSEATRITNDKYLAHLALKNENLPVADFALVSMTNKDALKRAFKELGGRVLIKPRFGGWGVGIMKFEDANELISAVEMMLSFMPSDKQQVLLEKFYENDLSKWISVVVIGGKKCFGYRKKVTGKFDWKIYDPEKSDGKGESSDYVEVPDDLREIAFKAQEVIGKDIIGFDFIYTNEGYKIIDENGRPGIYPQCLEGAGVDIIKTIVELVSDKKD